MGDPADLYGPRQTVHRRQVQGLPHRRATRNTNPNHKITTTGVSAVSRGRGPVPRHVVIEGEAVPQPGYGQCPVDGRAMTDQPQVAL